MREIKGTYTERVHNEVKCGLGDTIVLGPVTTTAYTFLK
jgi:hypothetical protein